MIKANDLRVGNIYLHTGIIDDFKENMVARDYEDWSPIPLTQDWLQRMGAVKTDQGFELADAFIFRKNYITGTLNDYEGFVIGFQVGQGYRFFGKPVLFVHEVQNIYRDFTGTEIQFNPHL